MNRSTHPDRGFTLAESLMATAVLALAVLAITQAIVSGQMQTYEALHDQRAVSLGEALVEEVLALPYADPEGAAGAGPDTGESNRSRFDNADDFEGFSESIGSVVDAAGNAYGKLFQRFGRSVAAKYGQQTVSGFADPIDGLAVTVTVTDDRGLTWTLSRFIAEPAS